MIKLDKDTFVSCINAIQVGLEKRNKFDDAIAAFSESYFICNVGDEWLNSLLGLLEKLMDDLPSKKYSSVIQWWLWEDKTLLIEEDDKTIERVLATPELLYDYLVEKAN